MPRRMATVMRMEIEARKMTEKELEELERLSVLWATGQAIKKQVLRCMELENKKHANE
jgi:hypothetical protein